MWQPEIQQRISDRSARLAVIGLGYVGLPVACAFAQVGFNVIGIDVLNDRIEKINHGISPIPPNEPELADLLASVIRTGRLHTTTDYQFLADRDIILVDVETPIDDQHQPRYDALRSALRSLGAVLQPGALVIIESTIAPGTMTGLVLPILSKISGLSINDNRSVSGFYLGHCPERVMPGKLLHNLRYMNRVVGGMNQITAEIMVALYRQIVSADLDASDCLTAELVKTIENAYRDVQIAFANEAALICDALGGDIWKVRDLVNKSPNRQMHLPGAGVGGHCIPKDPWLLAYSIQDQDIPLRLIPAARSINDGMPEYIIKLLQDSLAEYLPINSFSGNKDQMLTGTRILIMGYAYLEDSDDTRNSPSQQLIHSLQKMGAEAVIHDPYVAPFQGDLLQKAHNCDAAIIMVRHSDYSNLEPEILTSVLRHPVIVDGRALFYSFTTKSQDITLRIVGKAD